MQVATESKPGQTAVIALFVNAGSLYENQHNNGVAHFLEHLAFKVPFLDRISHDHPFTHKQLLGYK